jgi:hypothetical protein
MPRLSSRVEAYGLAHIPASESLRAATQVTGDLALECLERARHNAEVMLMQADTELEYILARAILQAAFDMRLHLLEMQ